MLGNGTDASVSIDVLFARTMVMEIGGSVKIIMILAFVGCMPTNGWALAPRWQFRSVKNGVVFIF